LSDTVLVDLAGAVTTITLNRPDAMNALTVEAKEALLAALSSAASDESVRAVVLTGTGRGFCVGQDLREHGALVASGSAAPLSTVTEHFNPLVELLVTMPKPVIAAINGAAAGAGLGIACACDFRIGAAGSRYTTAFTGIGLTADTGLSWTLPRLVGSGRAVALLMLAEPFTAEQALEMGMLNACVAPEQVLPAATELAQRLAAGPTAAYACVKEAVLYGADASLTQSLAKEDELQTRAGATADHAAAVQSFLEKKPPVFTGH
jgi:2-(1,2-epoxy-1,2-dihydrophenyl)acetyl-CoA isomerase